MKRTPLLSFSLMFVRPTGLRPVYALGHWAGPLVGLYEGWAQRAQPEPSQLGENQELAQSANVFFFFFTRPARPTGLRPVGLALGRSSTCRREGSLKRKYSNY